MVWQSRMCNKRFRLCLWAGFILSPFGSLIAGHTLAATPEHRFDSDLKQCLEWFLSAEAADYSLRVKNYPIANEQDLEGDFRRYFTKFREVSQDPKCSLLFNSKGPEDRNRFHEAFRSYPEEFQRQIILKSADYPTTAGDTVSLLLMADIFDEGRFPDIDQDSFNNVFVGFPEKPRGVVWDGNKNRYEYEDKELEWRTVTIDYWVKTYPDSFRQFFRNLDPDVKKRWMINTNSSDPTTHTEPLDLLQGSIVRGQFARANFRYQRAMSRIVLTKAVHRSLYHLFELTQEGDPRGAALSDLFITQDIKMRDPHASMILCAGVGNIRGLPDHWSSKLGPISAFFVNTQNIYEAENSTGNPVTIECNGNNYPLKSTPVAATPLPLPKAFDVKEIVNRHGAFNVLVTYSLTEETTSALIGSTIAFMNSHGFVLGKVEDNQSTVQAFEKYFTKTDLHIAAAHSIDVTKFPLGTARSRILHFWKIVKTHESQKRIPIHLVAIFPEQKGETGGLSEPLGLETLAKLFSERRLQRSHSLFSLTLSCHSPGAAIYWTHAYRRSLDLDLAEGRLDSINNAQDLVHAVAPKGGFPTELPSDLLLDMVPAINTIDMIGSGQSIRQVFERLSAPFGPNWFIKAIVQIERWFKIEVPHPRLVLDPVYNLDIPNLLDSSGYILEVLDQSK